MATFESPLKNLKVASPCSQDWEAMYGDSRKRFCGECKLNVYNLSGMSKDEAETLLSNAEGRVCVRFYQRVDGTVLTQDCPVGWAKVKERAKTYVTAVASLIFTFFGALSMTSTFKRSEQATMGLAISNPTPKRTPTPKPTPQEAANVPTMGAIAVNPDKGYTMGKVKVD